MKTRRAHMPIEVAFVAMLLVLTGCGKPAETSVVSPPAAAPVVDAAANTVDAEVTTHVKTALLQDEALKGFDIAVVTLKGDVRLTGVVDNQSQIDAAIKLARAADGVHSIHDELSVKK